MLRNLLLNKFNLSSKIGSSKGSSQSHQSTSGLAALQNMAMIGSGSGQGSRGHTTQSSSHSSSKDSLSALFSQSAAADTQAFIKQQEKLLQQLPANSVQRKTYEAILAEMKQAAEQR